MKIIAHIPLSRNPKEKNTLEGLVLKIFRYITTPSVTFRCHRPFDLYNTGVAERSRPTQFCSVGSINPLRFNYQQLYSTLNSRITVDNVYSLLLLLFYSISEQVILLCVQLKLLAYALNCSLLNTYFCPPLYYGLVINM